MVEHASDHFKVWPLLILQFIQDGKIPLDRFAAILEVIQHTKPLQPSHPTSILLINKKARSTPTVFCYHCTHYNANLKHKSLYDLVARDPILASEWSPNHHMVCHLLIIYLYHNTRVILSGRSPSLRAWSKKSSRLISNKNDLQSSDCLWVISNYYQTITFICRR